MSLHKSGLPHRVGMPERCTRTLANYMACRRALNEFVTSKPSLSRVKDNLIKTKRDDGKTARLLIYVRLNSADGFFFSLFHYIN